MFCFSLLRAPLVLVAPLDPLAKPERTYVYICVSTSIFKGRCRLRECQKLTSVCAIAG